MPNPITPADLANWEAVCESVMLPWQEGCAGLANIVSFDGDDIHGVANVWNTEKIRFIVVASTAFPRLLAAYREVQTLLADAAVPLEVLRYTEVENAAEPRALCPSMQQEIITITDRLRNVLLPKE